MSMMPGKSMVREVMAFAGLGALPAPSAAEEADHRIANSLQLLSALIGMEARQATEPDVRAALERTLHRVAAVAGVHRQTTAVRLGASVVWEDLRPGTRFVLDVPHP